MGHFVKMTPRIGAVTVYINLNKKAMAFGTHTKTPLKNINNKINNIRTTKNDFKIHEHDIDILMKHVLDSVGQGPEVYEGIKLVYRMLNGKSILNPTKILPLLTKFTAGGNDHHEQNKMDMIRKQTHTYYTGINLKPQGRYKGNSYSHEPQSRVLLDTEDNNTMKRADLRASCGFNQKLVCFFQTKSFISFNDLFDFTHCESQIEKAIEKQQRTNPKLKKEINIRKVNCYSLVHSITTKLIVNNDSKSYIGYIKVHLLSLKNYKNCENSMGTLTIDQLISYYIEEIESINEDSIKQTDFIKRIDASVEDNPFMTRILVAPYTDVLRSQVIEDHLDILETYHFELKPSETGIITVVNNLNKGINLFELYKYVNLDVKLDTPSKLEAPAGTFFILEAVGSSNAEVVEISDKENRYNGTAPLKIRLSETIVTDFKIDHNNSTDIPAIYTPLKDTLDFIDAEIGDKFSPPKKAKINFDVETIDLDGTGGKNKKWILSQDQESSLVTMSQSVRAAAKDPSLDYIDALNLNRSFKNDNNNNNEKNTYNNTSDTEPTLEDL